MQKLKWSIYGVAVVVSLVGINLVAEYGARHPNSLVGRCVIGSYLLNERITEKCQSWFGSLEDTRGTAVAVAGGAVQNPPARPTVADPTPAVGNAVDNEKFPERLPGKIVIEGEWQAPDDAAQIPPQFVEMPGIVDIHFQPAETEPQKAALDVPRMPYADENKTLSESIEFGLSLFLSKLLPWSCPQTESHPQPAVVPALQPVPADALLQPIDELIPRLDNQKNPGTHFEESLNNPSSSGAHPLGKYSWLQRIRKRLMDDITAHDEIDTTEFRRSDAPLWDPTPTPY